ncbi:MAG: MTAP family purine nucleoside phosphorylase [Armatimonadetes bacterium]|nr:MTAP family purine nucleoside phosphorylase [Armatimonadota bacterium]
MEFDVAIIGGTGIGSRLVARGGTPVHIPTPRGTIRGRHLQHGDTNLLLLSRHSAGHKVPPHKVNYVGMATALQQVGVKYCLSSAAVGSLRPEWGPGTMVVCSDFFDFTFRNTTMFDETVVHTDFTYPFARSVRAAMQSAASAENESVEDHGIYVCGNGPRYETPEEIKLYARVKGDVVGMTAASEAIVMREAGVDYGCLAVVTNLAAGIAYQELSHQEVEDEMKRSGEKAVRVLLRAASLVRSS